MGEARSEAAHLFINRQVRRSPRAILNRGQLSIVVHPEPGVKTGLVVRAVALQFYGPTILWGGPI